MASCLLVGLRISRNFLPDGPSGPQVSDDDVLNRLTIVTLCS